MFKFEKKMFTLGIDTLIANAFYWPLFSQILSTSNFLLSKCVFINLNAKKLFVSY